MLTKCPECELQVSDKALTCPHCGYPMKSQVKRKYNKGRKRLPNGFGQISELKGQNLRKPFRAMVTVGKNSYGKPICKILKPEGFFETYNEAYAALVEYNKSPYDLDDDILLYELYNRWTEDYFKSVTSPTSRRTITSAWAHCEKLYNIRAKDVRSYHIKNIMEEMPSANLKQRIKSLFNLMLDYAVEYEIVDRNYARTFTISENIIKEGESQRQSHLSFSKEEMDLLWANAEVPYVDIILLQCYSGWRPQELGLILLKDVDLENMTMKGGMKTEAGTDRIAPIHPKVQEFAKKIYALSKERGSRYFISEPSGRQMTYDIYRRRFKTVVDALKLDPAHRAHDPRKQFVTMAKKAGVDEYAIKKLVGHSISDITEKVYTDRDPDWLRTEIEKIS